MKHQMSLTLNGFPALATLPPGRFVAPNGKTVYVRDDDVAVIFEHVARFWHEHIEKLPKATYNEWPNERRGYIVIHGYRPPGSTVGVGDSSNHRSGTAIDILGDRHPYKSAPGRDGFTPAQRAKLRAMARDPLLKRRDGKSVIRLGIDFEPAYYDPMHVEIAPGTTEADLRLVAARLRKAKGMKTRAPKGIRASVATGRKAPALTLAIQQRVRYFDPSLKLDGIFGKRTEAAVKAWQRALGVTPDGIVGPETIKADLARVGSLRRGSRGSQVRFVQYVVGVERDGVYGPVTEAAVKECQAWAGLDPDGIFGPQSRAKLIRKP